MILKKRRRIDNTLSLENTRIENGSAGFRASFSLNANPEAASSNAALSRNTAASSPPVTAADQLVHITSGGHTLSWSLTGRVRTPAGAFQASAGEQDAAAQPNVLENTGPVTGPMPLYAVREQNLRSDSVAEIETEEQAEDETEYEKTVVKKAVSSILYENAMGNGIDVRYTVAPYSVKEDIILREKTVFHSYTMHVDANGLTAVKTEDNRVEFRNAENQMVFTLKTPYMYDAADAISGDIEIAVVQEGEDCTITYTPDSAWLNDEARVYPVTIDPESTSRYHAVSDTYVHEGDGSCCSGVTPSTYGRLYIGKKGGRVHRAYLKIETLPSVPAGSYIEASTLYAQCYAGTSTSKPFSLNKVTASWWNASTLGWNPQPSSTDIQANVNRNTSTNVIAFTNCRDTVARMYNGNMENNGFMIHYTDETQNDYNSIYSYENSNTSGHPYLWVQYRAPANIANGTYYIRNKNSGLYLDVPNWGGSGTGLKQYSFNAGTNQKWKIEKQSNGLYTFKPMHNTNLAMDVYNALDQDGAAVWTYTANGSAAQEWYIIPNLYNTYRIVSRCSNGWRGLVVSGASKAEGAEVFQYTYTVTENTNDNWYLEPTAHKVFSTIGITDAGHDHTSYMDRLCYPLLTAPRRPFPPLH